jgi:hypothetical protein
VKNHIVNKVSIRLPASDFDDARKLQQNAQSWSSIYLPGVLEKSLDEFCKNEDYLFIDKIEIDITKYPWQLTVDEWKKKLVERISEFRISELPAEIILKQWIFYLQNGVFERNVVIGKVSEIENYFAEGNLKFTDSEIQLLSRVFTHKYAIKRLFYAHSETFVRFILEHFFSLKNDKPGQLFSILKHLLTLNEQSAFEVVKELNSLILQKETRLKDKLVEAVLQNPETLKIDGIIAKERTAIVNSQPDDKENETEAETILHCANAGLVLLLPFIKPLFENLNLVDNNVFISETAKYKACSVLHFLATGTAPENEQELMLPKILCGVEIYEFVEPLDINEENVKIEVNDLLKSVIQYWEVLKNTSVDSLRETFLKRDGQLKIESAFLLQVSNSGVDILLSKLPWGFRNYKLPWMQKSIITEWH